MSREADQSDHRVDHDRAERRRREILEQRRRGTASSSARSTALMSDAICVRCPAASATEVFDRLPSVGEAADEARRRAGHALRDELLVGVDRRSRASRHRAVRRRATPSSRRRPPPARRAGAQSASLPSDAGQADREQAGRHVARDRDAVVGQGRAASRRGSRARHDQRPRPPREQVAHQQQHGERADADAPASSGWCRGAP